MRKDIILLISLLTILAVLSVVAFSNVEQIISKNIEAEEREYDLMWTKAICNEEFCQDYEIHCKDNKVISQTPITGAILVVDKNWEDPRPKEMQEQLC